MKIAEKFFAGILLVISSLLMPILTGCPENPTPDCVALWLEVVNEENYQHPKTADGVTYYDYDKCLKGIEVALRNDTLSNEIIIRETKTDSVGYSSFDFGTDTNGGFELNNAGISINPRFDFFAGANISNVVRGDFVLIAGIKPLVNFSYENSKLKGFAEIQQQLSGNLRGSVGLTLPILGYKSKDFTKELFNFDRPIASWQFLGK